MPSRPRFDWKLRTRTLTLGARTLVMQIVNLTPDSFSGDGLAAGGEAAAIDFALAALDNGADILDLGAESTRPGAAVLTPQEEQQRLMPVLRAVLRLRPSAVVSVDTYQAQTAQAALDAGAEIVNDVSGLLWDERTAPLIASARCGLVLMHTRGRSQEWAALPPLRPEEVVPLVCEGLQTRLAAARHAGIADESIVLDPGFGFGKLGKDNLTLLAHLDQLAALGLPLLAGLSRKRFLGDAIAHLPQQHLSLAHPRLHATIAANTLAIVNGAHIVRVHDLKAAQEAAAIADAVLNEG